MTKALIIGAGIGGPAAAMALRKVGIESTIYEAYEGTAHDVGATMGMSTNGLDALRLLGAHEGIKAAGIATPRSAMWTGRGRLLMDDLDVTADTDSTVSVMIRRADVYAALHEEVLRRELPVAHGKRLTGLTEHGGKVVAEFADGGSASGDLLIAADGMRSTVRAKLFPDAPKQQYVGILGGGGFASGVELSGPHGTPGTFHMVFGKRAFFGYVPAGDGEVWWFANVRWPKGPGPEGVAPFPRDGWKQRLLGLFEPDMPLLNRIIEATPGEVVFDPMHQLAAPRRWYRGRSVLIGDAAHVTSPSSGQGASLAIEDALELARCLRDRPDPVAAFAAFQGLREERVARIHRGAQQVNRSKAAGPVGRMLMHAMMPVVLKYLAKPGSMAWITGHRIDFDARV
ncbi:FAD-dependent oxidoreductase [Amycolatopsis nigrescens]|uniref:FAD-dependent oxidoreductase n=1 Tax=Amycolatopsis nigrescens TaxID=381445 RepID=UPI0003762944|nr:FAD-dependent monooxygenase [Amycolatopsis nigrescens]